MAAQSRGGPGDFTIPDALPVLPLRDAVVFPLTAVPLLVQTPSAIRVIDDVMRGNRLLVFVAQRNDTPEPVTPESIHRVGTVGAIHQMARMPDGGVRAMVQGIERVRLLDFVAKDPYLVARIEPAREPTVAGSEVDGLRRAVLDLFRRLAEVSSDLPDELAVAAESLVEPRQVVYFVASLVRMDTAARQALLEVDSIAEKLRRLIDVLQGELTVREIGRKITSDTEQRLSRKQRDYILREQVKTIQKELGEEDSDDTEAAELRRRIQEAGLPDEARRAAERELKRRASRPCASGGRRASARPACARASPGRSGESACACRSAACATRRRSGGIGARTSARFPGASSRGCAAQRRRIPSSCSTRSTRSARTGGAIRPRRCWRCWTRRRTTPSSTPISACRSTSRRSSSSPPATRSTPSRARCATGWKS